MSKKSPKKQEIIKQALREKKPVGSSGLWVVRALAMGVMTSGLMLVGCQRLPTPVPLPPTVQPVNTSVSPHDGMPLVFVPAGAFEMGNNSDATGYADETPKHTVTLDAFWIDQTEVTNAMFQQFVKSTGYQTEAEKGGNGWVFNTASKNWEEVSGADWQHPRGPSSTISGLDDHPVVQVSWNDATAYCAWAGERLPTEAEWEKAARGTDGRTYPWGNQAPDGNLLNYADRRLEIEGTDKKADDGYQFTAPVGHYPSGASPYGALDMAGNVWEWVADWYSASYYSASPSKNPPGPATGDGRVLRGGAWHVNAVLVRATQRGANLPNRRYEGLGFRCARAP